MHGLVLATVPIWKTGWSMNTCPGNIQHCMSTFWCSVNQIIADVMQLRLVVGYRNFGAPYPTIFLFLFLFLSLIYFSFYFFLSTPPPSCTWWCPCISGAAFPHSTHQATLPPSAPSPRFHVLHAPLTGLCTNHDPHTPYTTVHLCIPSILLAILDSWWDQLVVLKRQLLTTNLFCITSQKSKNLNSQYYLHVRTISTQPQFHHLL